VFSNQARQTVDVVAPLELPLNEHSIGRIPLASGLRRGRLPHLARIFGLCVRYHCFHHMPGFHLIDRFHRFLVLGAHGLAPIRVNVSA
jgi:hypothetical protein